MVNVVGFLKENKHKKITFLVWLYTGIYRFLICFVPMRYLRKHFGTEGEESSDEAPMEQLRYAKMISGYVNRSADKTIWESKCLVRALTAQRLLKRKKIDTTLYLGVGKDKDKMIAHAWLRCGRLYVTGGDGTGYAIVARYKMTSSPLTQDGDVLANNTMNE